MNETTAWTLMLFLEAAALILLTSLVAKRLASSLWKRTAWQSCFVGLLVLLALEATGGAGSIARLTFRKTETTRETTVVLPAAVVREPREKEISAVGASGGGQVGRPPYVSARATLTGGPGHVDGGQAGRLPYFGRILVGGWLLGALGLLLLHGLARLRLAVLLRRSRRLNDTRLEVRVVELAGQLGITRRIRLFEASRFAGPVAWGILRPAIGLPAAFSREHSPAEQEAMLAHELAHLAAWDPAWYLLTDVLVALLWWHPLVWWARRRLQAASEMAADEASLLVRDGPGMLAQSLVALGARLDRPRPAAWLGIEGRGFRSGLARRVERLLKLSGREWSPPGRLGSTLARTLVPATLVATVILCAAWTVPETSTRGENMKKTNWKRSLGLFALFASLVAPDEKLPAAEPPKEQPVRPGLSEPAAAPKAGAADLRAKLEGIVIDQLLYDGLPLGEVIKALMRDAVIRDPEKVGVNFLFGQPSEPIQPPTAIDPATGLPVVANGVNLPDVSSVTIRIVPALRKVRLIDALDAMVRVADYPIAYTIESYAVVFTLDGRRINSNMPTVQAAPTPAPAIQTRAFKVDTNTFFASMQRMFGFAVDPTDGPKTDEALFQGVFPKLGLKLGSDGLVRYNPLTGVLLVRARASDFATIQAALDTLGGSPVGESGGGASPAKLPKDKKGPASVNQ